MGLQQTLKHVALAAAGGLWRAGRVPVVRPQSVLVLQYASALGTVVHATPLLKALREAMPNGRITVAASGFALEVMSGNPHIDRLIATANPTKDWRAARRDLAAVHDAMRSDVEEWATVTPLGNERTTIALAAAAGGARGLVGFTLAPELYSRTLEFDASRSQIANNLRLVEALGFPAAGHCEPEMFFTADDLNYARELMLAQGGLSASMAVFVTQTSPTQRKGWRAERFAAAAQHLFDRHGVDQILFVGAASERTAIDAILPRIRGNVRNVAGETNLRQLAALLSLADVGLTLDTGTLHVGRAVGLPMVVVAPAWSPPVEWLPVGDPRFRILKHGTLDAAPRDYVIDEVSVAEVTRALDELLRAYPRGAR